MKLSIIINLLLLLLLTLQTHSKFSFYEQDLQPTTFYKCIKASSNNRIILNLTYDETYVESSDLQNIDNALAAGLVIELIIVPYRCRSVEEEILFLQGQLKNRVVDKFWVSMKMGDRDCSWEDFEPEENCQYLQELITKASMAKMKIEVATESSDWIQYFGSQAACPEPSYDSLLWQLNPKQTAVIGGWKSAYMRFGGPLKLCGQNIDLNFIL